MLTPETYVEEFVQHATRVYDPAKAREYYLRTRQLKGRQPGRSEESGGRKPGSAKPGTSRGPKANTAKERRREIEARVAALKVRLEKLRNLLTELVKQAQARSGIDPKGKKDKSSPKKAGSPGTKKQTAAQKREAQKRSKEHYEKNKDKTGKKEALRDQEEKLEQDIKEVRKKIAKAREDLKASIARARNQSNGNQTGSAQGSRQS